MTHSEHYTLNQRAALSQLLRVTGLMRDDMQRGLLARGLTEARAHLLWELGPRQPVTQRELAAVLAVTPRNVTTLLDALEGSGHVMRRAHPGDRRAVLVSLSAAGEAALAQLQADMAELAGQLFGGASAEELAVFLRLVEAAAGRLEELARP